MAYTAAVRKQRAWSEAGRIKGETGVRQDDKIRDNSVDDRRFIIEVSKVHFWLNTHGKENDGSTLKVRINNNCNIFFTQNRTNK